jgi:hypothetical protein
MASTAAAEWTTKDYPEDGTYSASSASEGGRAKFVISCNVDYPESVQISAGERYDPGASYPDKVPISVMTDGRQQPVFDGSFKNVGGNLVLISGSATLATILDAIAASKSTIDVQFAQREYRFSAKGSTAAVRHMQEKCQ